MAASVPSLATPRMLAWARTTAGFSIDDVSKAEDIEAEKLSAWESGDGTPSLAVLGRLAKRYKRPLMVFYLEEPPQDFTVIRDFRRLPASASHEFSTALRFAIRFARERQEWASNELQDSGAGRCVLVGSMRNTETPRNAANAIRNRFGITLASQVQFESSATAYSAWRKRAEDLGIFVFQTSRIDVEEMRGCALSDNFAPVVIVNSKDSYTAKLFTLIHEIVHILLGVSAISGKRGGAEEPQWKIERFCNRVTAEVLVPEDDFRSRLYDRWLDNDDSVISNAAGHYNTSRLTILLRLLEIGAVDRDYVEKKWPLFVSVPRKKLDPDNPPKIPQHVLAIARGGESFTRLAMSAYYGGEIHAGELSNLLRMKLKHLPTLEAKLYPNRIQPLSA